jgi:prepilin-type N-terminal cleavage/methylation domain-containing protein
MIFGYLLRNFWYTIFVQHHSLIFYSLILMRKSFSLVRRGFTLIELLIVIAIIAILAAVVFAALNPVQRFQDARDSVRDSDTSEVLSSVKLDQVDNGGTYLAAIAAMTADQVYMIGTAVVGCDDQNAACDTDVSLDANCVNIAGLVTEGYMGEVPISPNGAGTWTASVTGYTMERDTNDIITVRACESENTTEIFSSR